ncbi:rhodanese-like domain-containing protein [Pedosphaera parvula]|uniref:Rhodanese domain protein n=1 Tax=Pedosphaera parvula (strain Ellin514) TaxID=320771 RepID=B9XC75_PEDPL|nr:rhodanese-like domain-containing protein [Pedosphaera parvula]EEF62543.1 Rhodanese domain protein [Pedosphaera parvula Ellin514]
MITKLTMPNPVEAKKYFEDKITFTTGPVELERMIKQHENINVIDVREEEDYRQGHVPGAINLPKERWETLEGLSKDRTNVLYCYNPVCHLAATAGVEFASKGFPVMEMEGGFKAWQDMDLEIEKPQINRMFAFRNE